MSLFTGHKVDCTAKNTQKHNMGLLNHNRFKENFSRVFARSTRDTCARAGNNECVAECTNTTWSTLQDGHSGAHAIRSLVRVLMKFCFIIMRLGNVQFLLMPVQLLHVCNYFLPSTTLEHPNAHFPCSAC